MTAVDASYYENTAMWAPERYVAAPDEVRRFNATAALIGPEVGSVLDVGAGNGAFLKTLEGLRPELQLAGIERSNTAIQRRVCATEIQAGSADDLPLGDQSVDLVTALEVIEHLPYGVYEKSLAELQRVARRQIMVSVPYRENRLLVRCPYCTCRFNPHYHMRRYDDETMQRLFPDFRCDRLVKVSVPEAVLKDAFRGTYRWLRSRGGFFPSYAMCPQCGYNQAQPTGETARPEANRPLVQSASRLEKLFPTRMVPRWVIGLYSRV